MHLIDKMWSPAKSLPRKTCSSGLRLPASSLSTVWRPLGDVNNEHSRGVDALASRHRLLSGCESVRRPSDPLGVKATMCRTHSSGATLSTLPWNKRARQHPRRQLSSSASSSPPSIERPTSADKAATALVIGSSGALGSSVSRYLSSMGTIVLGADVVDLPPDLALDGFELDGFVQLPRDADLTELATALFSGVDHFLASSSTSSHRRRLDAIVCASGGWQMDPTPAKHIEATELSESVREYAESTQKMIRMNLDPVVAASFVAQHCMNADGLMVVMGASAALQPTPGMLGYGVSKCAAHHVVRTLGASTGKSLETKSVRQAGAQARKAMPAMDSLTCIGILPAMIDTPANRTANPTANTAQWTKPRDIAKEIGTWIANPLLRPHSGSLLKVHRTADGNPCFDLVR